MMIKPENTKLIHKPGRRIDVRYRNPAAELLSACATVFFWLIYFLAYCLILFAGLAIIIGLVSPRFAWYLLNHSLDQYYVERVFKDEL